MMSSRSFVWTASAIVAALGWLSPVLAQYEEAEWTDFDYAYDLSMAPSAYDLDGNGSPDFTDSGFVPVDGVITISDGQYFESPATGVWHTNIAPTGYATGYTFEFRAKVISQNGEQGATSAFLTPADGTPAALIHVGTTTTTWGGGTVIDDGDNAAEFHTFRVAQLPGAAAYHVWRDGELIGYELGQGFGYAPAGCWFGAGASVAQGTAEYDYAAITPGVYVPVGFTFPEPDPIEDMTEQTSDSFAFKYEMDVDPTDWSAIDLDSNFVQDFSLVQSGTSSSGLSGNGTWLIESPDADSSSYLQGGESVPYEAWPNANFTKAEGYTVEFRVKVTSQADEAAVPFGIGTSAADASDLSVLLVSTSNTRVYNGPMLDESDNSDDFHTFRIVRDNWDFRPTYWIWRDGILLTPEGVGGSVNSSFNGMYIGDISGATGGTVEIDYLRFDRGTFAPVGWTYPPSEDLPGDLNGDGMVGSADLDIVRANWGSAVTPGDLTMGDPSGDGSVGSADLDIIRANWGQTAPANVPEPSVLLLLLAGLVLLGRRR